jgi:hypothetical protein
MRLQELAQVAPYHDTLNPALWDNGQLLTEVRYKLMMIARHFANFLKVDKLNLKDITISGSNAGYGYSEFSDIDLHLVVEGAEEHAELFTAKKNQYNFTYDLKINGIPVELYVQDAAQTHHSAGIYSILNDQWLSEPKHSAPVVSEREVRSKARSYAGQINQALRSNNLDKCVDTMEHIYRLRKAGLESGGEFSVENLAFKLLRDRGQINKLRKYIDKLQSAELSLEDQL